MVIWTKCETRMAFENLRRETQRLHPFGGNDQISLYFLGEVVRVSKRVKLLFVFVCVCGCLECCGRVCVCEWWWLLLPRLICSRGCRKVEISMYHCSEIKSALCAVGGSSYFFFVVVR